MIKSTSNILYVRASLKPYARNIIKAGGVIEFFKQSFEFEDIFSPYFQGARPFWRPQKIGNATNSGALGKSLAKYPNAFVSHHPSHRFVGVGDRLKDIFESHDHNTSCFFPISEIALQYDFSMLLIGCLNESPGFSTVHATQYELGLTQRHLIRYLFRWDMFDEPNVKSITAKEAPGCSVSFSKFYSSYEADGNLVKGELFGQQFLFIKSAKAALSTEKKILTEKPRFVDCGRLMCPTCRLRLY